MAQFRGRREVSKKETNIESAKDALKITNNEIKALFSLRKAIYFHLFSLLFIDFH